MLFFSLKSNYESKKNKKNKLISSIIIFAIILNLMFVLSGCNNKPEDETTSELSSDEITSQEMSSQEILSQEMSSQDMSSEDMSSHIPADNKNNEQEITVSEIPNFSIDNLSEIEKLSNKKNGWGPGTGKDFSRPVGATDAQNKWGQYDAYFIAPDTKKVYLTFDEGYENGYTPAILDTLKEKNVSAVFFVTYDFVKNNPDLVKRMIDEGHIVGNHSHKHPSFPDVSTDRMIEEISFLHNYVKENFNYEMKYFRFPMGEYSDKALAICKALGYKSVFWSFAYLDWNVNSQPDPDKAFNIITKNAHNGCIYLLHAVSKTNTEILGRVIDDIKNKGYELSTFDL